MDRGHLGTEDGVILAHILGKDSAVDVGRNDGTFRGLLLADTDGSQKGTDTDTGSSQVAYLVDLQAGINLAGIGQNILNGIRGDGIQAAAKGIELDQVQVFRGLYIVCSCVETAVVHPLVHHDQRALRFVQVGDGILRKHCQSVRIDQFRNPVIDLGVNVVGTSGEDDSVSAGLLQPFQRFFAFIVHCLPGPGKFLPAFLHRFLQLFLRDRWKFRLQPGKQRFPAGKGEEGIAEYDVAAAEFINVIFDVFRIGSDDRAVVMIVGIREFIPFIGNAGIENILHTLTDQPGHMAVCQLRRVTLRLAGNGFNTKLVNLVGGGRREDHAVFEGGEKFEPERIVLVHIQNPGNSNRSPFRLICRQRFIPEDQLVFKFIEIRDVLFVFFLAKTAFTAVSADKLTTAGKTVDGQTAVVGAALAFCHGCGEFQLIDFVNGEHGRLGILFVSFPGNQSSSESSHDSGNIRTDGFTACNLFKGTEHGVVVKGSALNHDMMSQLRGIGNLDYLI